MISETVIPETEDMKNYNVSTNGKTHLSLCFHNGVTCFRHVLVYGLLFFHPVHTHL